jgi:hypothetical protein
MLTECVYNGQGDKEEEKKEPDPLQQEVLHTVLPLVLRVPKALGFFGMTLTITGGDEVCMEECSGHKPP